MRQTKPTKYLIIFLLLMLSGCGVLADSFGQPGEMEIVVLAPEPTNTPVGDAGETFATTDRDTLADLLSKLQGGGYVLYVRHTHTDRTRGDTDVSLGQCDQQRILSERGRNEALDIREAYQQIALPVDEIISTQYCRTLETAVLAFGVPKVISRRDLTATLLDVLATEPDAGNNTIVVAHIGTLRQTVGLDDVFDEGDTLIFRPNGDTFDFTGRIGLHDWPVLADLSK